jgi:hypothetical protein
MPIAKTNQASSQTSTTRAPLVSGGFKRVNKKRPCRICGRSYYCGYSADERTSICMWVSEGPTYRGESRNAGNIHVHTDIPVTSAIHQNTKPSPPSIPLAPLEIRHAVFQELIRISPATNYDPQLISGPGGLYSRGLLPHHATNYGALPPTQKERAALASALRNFVHHNFSEYAKLYSGAGVVGLPGFWQEPSGLVHIWKPRNYKMPLLVIPYKNGDGLIQACQIRLHSNDVPAGEKKYRWLASPLERLGTSSGTPIHFTFLPKNHPAGGKVVITEGALKAETFVRFRPLACVIATTGVSCSHSHIIEAARPYDALIAFDADHRTNPAVCRQLSRLIAQRTQDPREHNLASTTKIVFWEGPKGIDEAAYENIELTTLSITEWFATLKDKPLDEVTRFWKEIGFTP